MGAIVGGWCWSATRRAPDLVFEPKIQAIEPAPLCPWRDPEADLHAFFPEATGYRTDTKVLSAERLELQKRLGRPLAPEEMAQHIERVLQGDHILGSILTRRVKGEYGAIEFVLAVGPDLNVRGLRLQRSREPESVEKVLKDSRWLESFSGRGANAAWRVGGDLPDVPDTARPSAQAVADGVRSELILLSSTGRPVLDHSHHF